LDIKGTPAFVIGDSLTPGAVDIATLRRLVAAARKS
jgi:protein-disulfide isomerase